MEILNFINFKFEDLHKAKKLGFGVLSYSRASKAEQRRQSRRSSRHKSLLLRRKISINMEPITPERNSNTERSVTTNSNSKNDVFLKPTIKLTKKIEKKDELKKPDRKQLLKQWRNNREQKLKEEKQRQKPIFKVGGPSNIGFPLVKETEEKMNYSFAPKKHEFKPPANIKPLPMKILPLKKDLQEKEIENKSNSLTLKNKIIAKINTSIKSNLTSKINSVKTNTIPSTNTSVKKVNNSRVVTNKVLSTSSTNKNVINSKVTAASKNINTKTTKPDINKTINDTSTKSKNLNTNSKTIPLSNENRFLRVTRSQKVISSPVKSKLTIPSKKTNSKIIVKNNKKIPKVINLDDEKSKVQFQHNTKEDKKINIEYKKTPIVPNKIVGNNDTDQIHGDIDETDNNDIDQVCGDINDLETENKTPKLRKSLRIKKITESEKYEPVCIVCKFSCSDKRHQYSKIEDDMSKSQKRKTVDSGSIDSESNYKAVNKKTRRSDYNKTQEDITCNTESIEENVKTPKRRTRNQNVKNIADNDKKDITESVKNKKNSRKSIHNIDTKKIATDLNIENEKENIQQKTKTPKKTPKKNVLIENNDSKKDTDNKSKNKTPLKKNKSNSTTKTPDTIPKDISSSLSTEYSMDLNSSNSDNVFITPDSKNNSRSSIYISPFVTTSRGKGSTKKENKARQILGIDPYSSQNSSDTASTKYFHTILDNVIERLKSECTAWETYKESESITEDSKDLIDVALGQTNLLINKKFQQFRNLIYNCENGDGECTVTCEDLQGFWDMVYMQVSNLDIRFKRLADLKDNNWEEILPPTKKVIQPKKTKPVPQPKVKSNIREAIRAARLKSKTFSKKSENNETVFDGGFFVVKSPNKISTEKNTSNKKTPNKRKSLLTHVLSAEAKKVGRTSCSPGLATLKLSQTLKSVGKNKDLNQTLPTPGKSILKKKDNIKPHNISKVVLFKDEDSEEESTE